MQIIAAVDKNWGIGYKNKLLVSIPADQRFFRDTTMGGIVIAGRKTMEGLPGGNVLSGRRNILLTKKEDYVFKGAEVAHSVEEVLELVKDFPSDKIFVIGGESIYRQFLPYCDTAHITKIDFAYEADTHFPNLDEDEAWELIGDSEEQTYYNLEYYFCKYRRKF